jgi:1,4-alpha-glucan branching enzyme
MGGEFGQSAEWNHEKSLDWYLLDYPLHQGSEKTGERSQSPVYDQSLRFTGMLSSKKVFNGSIITTAKTV